MSSFSFKESLLRKIDINKLKNRVLYSVRFLEDYGSVDFESMRKLLDYAEWFYVKRRGIYLYLEGDEDEYSRVLVLDNDLAIYDTTLEDVLLRKNPTTKEMLSIRNVVKILKDDDVLVSRKESSIKIIEKSGLDKLDLSFSESDIDQIVLQGEKSFESNFFQGVKESLLLLSELAGFIEAPDEFCVSGYEIWGGLGKNSKKECFLSPIIIYDIRSNLLVYTLDSLSSRDKRNLEIVKGILHVESKEIQAVNYAVFFSLKKKIMESLG